MLSILSLPSSHVLTFPHPSLPPPLELCTPMHCLFLHPRHRLENASTSLPRQSRNVGIDNRPSVYNH